VIGEAEEEEEQTFLAEFHDATAPFHDLLDGAPTDDDGDAVMDGTAARSITHRPAEGDDEVAKATLKHLQVRH
jgi:hypothetical protein